jgi:hypothetical protein
VFELPTTVNTKVSHCVVGYIRNDVTALPAGLYLIVTFCVAFATVCSGDVTDSATLTDKDTIMIDRRPRNISW